jgi:hypothetical protein
VKGYCVAFASCLAAIALEIHYYVPVKLVVTADSAVKVCSERPVCHGPWTRAERLRPRCSCRLLSFHFRHEQLLFRARLATWTALSGAFCRVPPIIIRPQDHCLLLEARMASRIAPLFAHRDYVRTCPEGERVRKWRFIRGSRAAFGCTVTLTRLSS